jgi:hypothetical protein
MNLQQPEHRKFVRYFCRKSTTTVLARYLKGRVQIVITSNLDMAMLKRLSLLIALSIAPFLARPAIASPDIGGAPVKAIPMPASYSTIYSQTTFIDPFGVPQSIIITAPTVVRDSFGFTSYPSINYPQTIIVTPTSRTTTVRGILQPMIPIYPIRSSCATLSLALASGRSVSINASCQ